GVIPARAHLGDAGERGDGGGGGHIHAGGRVDTGLTLLVLAPARHAATHHERTGGGVVGGEVDDVGGRGDLGRRLVTGAGVTAAAVVGLAPAPHRARAAHCAGMHVAEGELLDPGEADRQRGLDGDLRIGGAGAELTGAAFAPAPQLAVGLECAGVVGA